RFVPALPIHINELYSRNIWFDYYRFTKPYINEEVLAEVFGNDADFVRNTFLQYNGFGLFS
ncbi:hypothetical protein OZK63_39800, partial [Streptomyces sp. UMAF16]|nr:hypothetical protein [Streptomyces sp. UMAF16]